MAAKVQVVEVSSSSELDTAISSYVVQGYVLANKTPASATMIKKKEFNVLWAVIGFIVCLLPLLIYLIVYAADSDKVVEIRVSGSGVSGTSGQENLSEIDRLNDLHDRKVISDEEFEAQKKKLLG